MKRNCGIELLRIVLMTCIVIGHVRWLYLPQESVGVGLKSLAVALNFPVDTFVLISGYFGIRKGWHALRKNYVLCLFYAVLLGLTSWAMGGPMHWEWMLMPWSRNLWWFMYTYFLLILIAPGIEMVFERVTSRQRGLIAITLLVVNAAIGFLHVLPLHYEGWLPVLNFVTIYCVGICLRENGMQKTVKRPTLLVGFCLLAGCNLLLAHLQSGSPIGYDVLSYASPVTLLQSICIFWLFLGISVRKSKLLTKVSGSIFAVYLITEYPECREWLRVFCANYAPSHPALLVLFITLLVIIVMTGCVMVDRGLRARLTSWLSS